jgi:hypothetical protein
LRKLKLGAIDYLKWRRPKGSVVLCAFFKLSKAVALVESKQNGVKK